VPLRRPPARAADGRRETLRQLADPHEEPPPASLREAHVVREVGPEPEQVGERRRDHDVRRGAVERLLIRRRRAQARRRRERGALRRVRFGEPPLVLVEAEVERGARGADRVFRQAQAVPERTRDVDGPGEPVPVVLLRLRRPPPARDPGGLLGVEGGRERDETREETHR